MEKNGKITDLKPDRKNMNKHTEYGMTLLEKSVRNNKFGRSILVDKDNNVIAGNGILETAVNIGAENIRIIETTGDELVVVKRTDVSLDSKQGREMALADNATSAADLEWDMEVMGEISEDWDIDPNDWGINDSFEYNDDDQSDVGDGIEISDMDKEEGNLMRDFILPPTSILDTRKKIWVDRVHYWKEKLVFDSGKGRDDELTYSQSHQAPEMYRLKNALRKEFGREPTWDEIISESEKRGIKKFSMTSIFDPFLCELCYRWFNVDGGRVLDPFAGGSVRGLMAGVLGYDYIGNDISSVQIEENRAQADENRDSMKCQPVWTIGDSVEITELVSGICDKFDMVFSCPPYADLEVYSDDPKDLSNMPYEQFIENYRHIIKQSCNMLKDNRFAVFVVGEVRKKTGGGFYRNFVADTTRAFLEAGMNYYNELILINPLGGGAMTARQMFSKNRKIVKTHQNVLVFYKGDVSNIRNEYSEKTEPNPSWEKMI